ncbi:MAG: transcriptional regulator, family [Lachnospiraceae bacterium]|nr:transcriptional regulator, family [Anaerocolumna sp.]MDF2610337.1 transcriptional regulator, family [Lachnospiraceae bacterium]
MKNELLSKRLKDLRKANSYTQEYVASYLNIGRQAYSHYETGRNTPSTETLYSIATLYSIPYNRLFELLMTNDNPYDYQTAPVAPSTVNDLSDFLEYMNHPKNEKKLKLLGVKEKELLYYFEKLTAKDQSDILDFIKIKVKKK